MHRLPHPISLAAAACWGGAILVVGSFLKAGISTGSRLGDFLTQPIPHLLMYGGAATVSISFSLLLAHAIRRDFGRAH